MTTNQELEAQIAAISSRIDQAKQQQHQQNYYQAPHYQPSYRGSPRWSPYNRGGRGGLHKNRTLIVKNATNARHSDSNQPDVVSTRGTHNQLMTKDTFHREQQTQLDVQDQQREAKRQKRRASEQSRILRHFVPNGSAAMREMVIEGIPFQLTSDGGKLIRVSDIATAALETPKRTKIVGVDFFRTKNGNLVRASTLRPSTRSTITRAQCENFTKHGTCPYGSTCHFAHNPAKVAICKDLLKTGACPRGANCDMSHEMTYHRVSACQFFLRGNCTNASCRYPHISVSPSAPVCAPFATLGYCAKGPDCDRRHVVECPDYANKGYCANHEKGKCSLPHPDRASILRKAAERQAKMDEDAESDLSSDDDKNDEDEIEDIDSEEEGVFLTSAGDDSHELSQQQDYVGLN